MLNGTRVVIRAFDVNDVPVREGVLKTGCVNADCVEVARQLIDAGYKPAILNLASRRHPCGGYDKGCNAQEEALCRVSTLSQSLYQLFDEKYKCVRDARVPMRPRAYPLDIDFGGVYSPDVTFFREGKNKLPCEAVAGQFRRVLEEPEFKGKFAALVFAILEGRGSARRPVEESGKFAPFYGAFGRWE